jgi:putative transposase
VVAIKPIDKLILDIHISFERTIMFVTERFLKALIKRYVKHPLSTDGDGTWYPQACNFLKIDHHIRSSHEKSIIERTVQYLKDRTAEMFDDYFPCRKYNCKFEHTKHWLNLFVDMRNDMVVGRIIK